MQARRQGNKILLKAAIRQKAQFMAVLDDKVYAQVVSLSAHNLLHFSIFYISIFMVGNILLAKCLCWSGCFQYEDELTARFRNWWFLFHQFYSIPIFHLLGTQMKWKFGNSMNGEEIEQCSMFIDIIGKIYIFRRNFTNYFDDISGWFFCFVWRFSLYNILLCRNIQCYILWNFNKMIFCNRNKKNYL